MKKKHVHKWGKWEVEPDKHDSTGNNVVALRYCDCGQSEVRDIQFVERILNQRRPKYRKAKKGEVLIEEKSYGSTQLPEEDLQTPEQLFWSIAPMPPTERDGVRTRQALAIALSVAERRSKRLGQSLIDAALLFKSTFVTGDEPLELSDYERAIIAALNADRAAERERVEGLVSTMRSVGEDVRVMLTVYDMELRQAIGNTNFACMENNWQKFLAALKSWEEGK